MTKVAYIRVSSTGQNLDAQREAMLKAGAEKVFEEKRSGVDQDRPVLRQCLEYLREGDELICTKADRLARSASNLLSIADDLASQGVTMTFLDQPELSTSSKTGKLVLTILAGVAEFEREIIRERQHDGIKAAQKKGVKFGRPAKLDEDVASTVRNLREQGATVSDIKAATGLGKTSIYKALRGG